MLSATIPHTSSGKLHFTHLPAFASYLLRERLDDMIAASLRLARDLQYPLLSFFAHLSEDELLQLSRVTQTELLTHFINNTLDEQIEQSMKMWQQNQLPLIEKDQIVGDDITMGSYIRKNIWSRFVSEYTGDMRLALDILSELDCYHLRVDALAMKTFIRIQNEKLLATHHALQESEALYRQAQALTHIGNWSWTIPTGKVKWSEELYRIYGLDPHGPEMTFEQFESMIHPEDRQRRIEQIRTSLQTLQPQPYVMRVIRPDGRIVILSGKNEIELDNTGAPYRMMGTCQDITTEYYLQQSLQDANKALEDKNRELERTNKELSSFNYVASHDLQEPLRKIKTYSDLIAGSEHHLSDRGRKYFHSINTSAQRMHQLIQDLLSYSRTHNYIADIAPVSLNTILSEIKEQIDDQIQQTGLILDIGDLPTVQGISFQLYQLFENLVHNAVKYRKAHVVPLIRIHAQKKPGAALDIAGAEVSRDYHIITVADNGIGFAPEFSHKIFEIFQRLHNADEYSGTGIGLAICKRIVQNHEGYITATGVSGEGATFQVYLPDLSHTACASQQ